MPRSGHVTLKVYNTLGQEAATLLAENRSAGKHEVTWYAEKLAGGLYFHRLQAGALTQIRKLILLK